MNTAALLLTLWVRAMPEDAGHGEVQFDAVFAKIPHQHPVKRIEGRSASYLDLPDGSQVVAYFEEDHRPKEGWTFRIHAEPHRFETQSKRPGSKEKFFVTQYLVNRFDRLIDGESTGEVRGMLFGLFTPSAPVGAHEALEAKILAKGKAAVFELARCADEGPANGKAGTCRKLLAKLLGALPVESGFSAWFEAREDKPLDVIRKEASGSKGGAKGR